MQERLVIIRFHIKFKFLHGTLNSTVSRGALSDRFEKRLLQTDNLQRRAEPQRYNFGLGR